MPFVHQFIQVKTEPGIGTYNLTPQLQEILNTTAIKQGQVLVFSRHTTTALTINESGRALTQRCSSSSEKISTTRGEILTQ